MLKAVEEFRKYVIIVGFTGARISNTDEFLQSIRKTKQANAEIQFFDARLVATWEHLYFATVDALTAFKNKTGISKSLTVEAMLYAAAQRQIRKATELFGIRATTVDLALLIIGEKKKEVESALSAVQKEMKAQRDDSVLKITKEKTIAIRSAFEISDLELETARKKGERTEEALTRLVIERMALLATRR